MCQASELSMTRCRDGLGNAPDDRGRQLEWKRAVNCEPDDESLARHGLPPILLAPRIGAEPDMSEKHRTDDLRIEDISDLVPPSVFMKQMALDAAGEDFVTRSRQINQDIMMGRDDRLLVVVGPCSIHDAKSALEYAGLLKEARGKYSADLELVMRVYFEKPRTTVGWKGFINDPNLDESFDINTGLREARRLLVQIATMGVPAGTEFLDVITPQYIADVVSWGAIGARTTESQVHRQLASGLSMPVGFKNGTDGNIQIALDAIAAAGGAHVFLSVTKHGTAAIVQTRGNEACHVILRGGKASPNYDAASVANAVEQLRARGLPPHLMVDCSHGNSLKDYRRQPLVAADVAAQIASGSTGITGVMIESHLCEGQQNVKPGQELKYGQSITDACVSWETTVGMLDELAAAVRARRAKFASA
jgi:3-deoxy-7-phosphoheptulonate synthase